MKKILVTGGCGYIGSHTVVALLQEGYEVVSIDSLEHGEKDVPDRVKEITGKSFHNHQVNLCNMRGARLVFSDHKDAAAVIHFAAYKHVGESVERPIKYYINNLVSLMNVLINMRELNIPNLIYSSSSAVYGNVKKLPVTEDTPVTEQQSPYGRSKYFGEQIISDMMKITDLRALTLRYFNPIGAHDSALIGQHHEENPQNIVPAITGAAAGKLELVVNGTDYPTRDGSCIRDYIHVMDVAAAHVLALQYLLKKEGEKSFHDVINLGTSTGVSVLEMIKAFEKTTGVQVPYKTGSRRQGDAIAVYTDYSKAKKLLGWSPGRSLEEMMLSAWKWEKANEGGLGAKSG